MNTGGYDISDWQYWFNKIYATMTDAEWFTFFLAILIGWVVVEYIKRSIVQKTAASKKNKLAIRIPLGKDTYFRLSIIHLISFSVTGAVVLIMWPHNPTVDHKYTIAAIAGVLSPVIHKLIILLLLRLGFRGVAAFLTGDKRLLKLPPTNETERRE